VSGVEACLDHAMAIPGAIGASVVDTTTGVALATAGAAPEDHEAAATGTAAVMSAVTAHAPFTSAAPDDGLEDLIITTAGGYHLIRRLPMAFDGRLVLYLWLDRQRGNLAVARLGLQDIGATLITP
jgi:hypothetical protein